MRHRPTRVLLALAWSEPGHLVGISRYAYENDWQLLHSFSAHAAMHPEFARQIRDFHPRGFFSQQMPVNTEIIQAIQQARVPVVELCNASGMNVPCVIPDNEAATTIAVQHLLDRRLTQFVCIGTSNEDLRRGFIQAVQASGHEARCIATDSPEMEAAVGKGSVGGILGHDQYSAARRAWARRFFSACAKPVGVFSDSLPWALDIIEGCRDARILVPEQVAVVGLADVVDEGKAWPVPLTVVAQDYDEQGYQAARLLDQMMKGKPVPPDTVVKVPPLALVPRLSTLCHATTNADIARAVTFIMGNLHEPGLCVKQVLKATKIPHTSFHRGFLHEFGVPAARYIEDLRLKEALHLLETTDAKIGTIARQCGFGNMLRFRSMLKRMKGMGPSLYRKQRIGHAERVVNAAVGNGEGERLKVAASADAPKGQGLKGDGRSTNVRRCKDAKGATAPGKAKSAPRASKPNAQLESQLESRPESLDVRVMRMLAMEPLGKKPLSLRLGNKGHSGQLHKVIRTLLANHAIEWTIPAKPNSRLQQYRLTEKGRKWMEDAKV